jgi:SAM-dependent methyltransferase
MKRLLRRIYYWGASRCAVCGRHARTRRVQVMWPELGEEWDLTPELYDQMSERDGVVCGLCGSTWRVRQLAETLLGDLSKRGVSAESIAEAARTAELADLQVAEINAVSGLHPALAPLPGLRYSEYSSTDPKVPCEDLMRLSYPDRSFDYVLTSDTLEHVPDFDRAMAEIRRILKPGGKHIFNIPVIWNRPTRQRAEMIDGKLKHSLPPSYHAGPQPNRDDYLVFSEFGGDVVERIERARFAVTVKKAPTNPLVSTLVAERVDA